MIGLAAVFAHRLMAVGGEDELISAPEIAEGMTALVGVGDMLPAPQTTGFASVAHDVVHNLPGTTTQCDPDPALIGFLAKYGEA